MDIVIFIIIGFVMLGTGLGILLILYTRKLFAEMQKNVKGLINKIGDDVKEALVINQSVNERVEIIENKLKMLEG